MSVQTANDIKEPIVTKKRHYEDPNDNNGTVLIITCTQKCEPACLFWLYDCVAEDAEVDISSSSSSSLSSRPLKRRKTVTFVEPPSAPPDDDNDIRVGPVREFPGVDAEHINQLRNMDSDFWKIHQKITDWKCRSDNVEKVWNGWMGAPTSTSVVDDDKSNYNIIHVQSLT